MLIKYNYLYISITTYISQPNKVEDIIVLNKSE